jgi:hypothetical protein
MLSKEYLKNKFPNYLVHIGPGDEEVTLIKVKDMRGYIHEYFDGVK